MSTFLWSMFWRESRASWKRLGWFVLSIAAGVGGLMAVKSFSYGLEDAIHHQARSLTAADLTLESRQGFTRAEQAALQELELRGADIVHNRSFAAMASAVSSTAAPRAHLVSARAVGADYPFYGEVSTRSGRPFRELLNDNTVLAHGSLLIRFGVKVGDVLRIGRTEFRIAGEILREPDRRVQFIALGPQLLMTRGGAAATELLGNTSRVTHQAQIRLPAGTDLSTTIKALKERLPERYASIRGYNESQPRVRRFLGRLTNYLNLVGLAALVLGGIGVAGAIRVFLGQKLDTLAILKCLGATGRQLLGIYLLQTLMLGVVGSTLGVLSGLALQGVLVGMLAQFMPSALVLPFSVRAMGEGMALGLLTTLWFALPPLWRVRKVPPALVFRREVEPLGVMGSRWREGLLTLALTLVLIAALVVWQVGWGRVASIAMAGLMGTFAALQLGCWVLLTLLRRMPKAASFVLRQGLSGLYRPGNQTGSVVISLGLGVSLVLAVFLIQAHLLTEIALNPAEGQPNLFFVDIQKAQRKTFAELLAAEGLESEMMTPLARGRIQALNDVSLRTDSIADEERRRALGYEYSFTYAEQPPPGEKLVEGVFVRDPAIPGAQVSISEWWARISGLERGDAVTVDIQGVPLRATITSIRYIDWTDRRPHFSFLFLPGALEDAPQMFIAAVRTQSATQQGRLQLELSAKLPNVSVIDAAAIMHNVQKIALRIGLVIQFMAAFCIAVGLVILLGAISTTRYQRMRETALYKTLGATRGTAAGVLATEYVLLGALAGLVGALGAGGLSWGMLTQVFDRPWQWQPASYLVAWGGSITLTLLTGLLNSWDVLRKKPLQVLRET